MKHDLQVGGGAPARRPIASSGSARGGDLAWIAVILAIAVADHAVADSAIRVGVLRGVLLGAAAGEALGAYAGIFRPRRLAERNGRPYDPAYHGVSQDFGFYNLAFAALFVFAALNPARATAVIAVAIVAYAIHGLTHVCRYFGVYYGGGEPIPTRPQRIELQQGLQLLAAAAGMGLFFP